MKALQQKILKYMEDKELPFHGEILYIDGTIHRYSSRHDNNKDEWYIGFEIETNKFIVKFASWRQEGVHIWRSYGENEIPNENLKMHIIEDQILEEQEKIQTREIKNTLRLYDEASICLKHKYLETKKIQSSLLKVKNDYLLIPMYNIENKLTSIQFINSKGEKRFKAGISTKNLYHILGDFTKASKYIVCEGYATGASIYENTNIPVIVAFSANNCIMIGKSFQNIYPNKKPALAVDNDKKGLETLDKWKKYINQSYYIPSTNGHDFNDAYNSLPKEEVNKILMPPKWKVKNIAEILAEDIPEEKWLNSILCEGTFNIIYGTGGVGKSRLAYEMALCLTLNEQFLLFETYGKFKVLYIDAEMTAPEIKCRFIDLLKRYSNSEFNAENFDVLRSVDFIDQMEEDLNIFNEEHRERLNAAIEIADVIFLDNFSNLTIPPDGDSYKLDSNEWQKFYSWMKVHKAKGKTFVLIMHANKDGRLQGVGKIRNDADLVIQLQTPIDLDYSTALHINVKYEKARKISIEKQRTFVAKLMPDKERWHGWYSKRV